MPPTDLAFAKRLDSACDNFEAAWRAGRKPRIEELLGDATGDDRAGLLKALIAVEIELRRAAGEAVKAGHYRKRFADDADAVASAFAEPGRPRAAGETSVSRESVKTGNFEARTDTARPATTDIPKQIGRFPVTSLLGAGAFGRVYRAKDPQLGREVAIKVPLPSAIATPADRERFLREARAAAGLHHPNICPVHEVGEENGHPYIVMGFVPGQSLAATLKSRQEPLAPKQAALIARKLALALDAAHKKGVVHRDLKPANVMFDKERRDVVVTDFGLARAPRLDDAQTTRDGVLMGTPAYMSPEQARGDTKAVGPASDQYALGVMLYEMLAGRRPFTGTVTEVLGKILHVEPDSPASLRPDLDPALAAACLKAMAKDPAARYASMREFADALLGFASDTPLARPASASAETAKGATETQRIADVFAFTEKAVEQAIRKHRTPMWMKVGLVLLIVGGLATIAGVVFFTRSKAVKVDLAVIINDVDLKDNTLTFFLDEEPIAAETLAKPVELKPGVHIFTVKRGKDMLKRVEIRVVDGEKPGIKVEDITPKEKVPVIPEESPELKPSPLDRLKAEDIPDRLMAKAYGARKNAPKELVAIYDSIVVDTRDLNENYFGGFTLDRAGGTLASGRYPYTIVELNNLATGRNYNTVATEPGGWVDWIRIAPDNQSIFYQRRSSKLVGARIGGKIRWEQAVRAENYSVPALSPDGKTLVAAAKDPNENALKVIDAETGAVRATWSGLIDKPMCRLAFSPDGQTLAVQSGGKVTFVSAKDGSVLPVAPVERTSGEPRFSPDGKRIYYSVSWRQPEDYCVEIELASGKRTEYRLPPEGCREIIPNPVFPILATNDSASHLHFWDSKLGPKQQPYVISTGAKVEKMLFTPEGRYLVVGAHNLIMIFRLPVERKLSEWAKVENKENGADGSVQLFNGKDLTGWKTHPDAKARWAVENDYITASGPVGNLFTERGDYENFVFRVEAKINDGGNSGQYFRAAFAPGFLKGYEAQINATHRDPIKTGSLYPNFDPALTQAQKDRLVVLAAPHKPDEWFTQEVTVVGNHITIKVNGITTVDFVDASNAYRKGHLTIQHHDPSSRIQVRKAEVKELPPGADEQGFVPLFNGKDLAEWDGLPGAWKWGGGLLLGTFPTGHKKNTFLSSKGTYRDFELKFRTKLHNPAGNSGVQIRSKVTDAKECIVEGPQVEIDGGNGFGGLYTEGAKKWMKQAPVEVVRRIFKPDAFNDYFVRVVGKHVKIVVNDEVLVDEDFPAMADEGVIAFQLNAGVKSDVTFRDVMIRDLSSK